ncbi:GGDEF domain-containing protein [Pleomorphomonas sp. PLEO]|uniref:GGDEF domain-containing protein n=1 Tax=Pleomorphomonas sp. PLEO TaxID=3239306 RepID=UPI00351E8B9F
MGGFLDIPTLLFTVSAASFCICVSLILIWSSARRETCILSWGVTFGLAVLTMSLVALRGRVPDVLSVTAADAVLLGSFGLLWLGYRQFTGLTSRFDRWIAGAGALIWVVIAATSSLFDDINTRSAVLSGIEFAYLLFVVVDLVRHYPHEPLPSVGLTTVLVGAHAAVQIYRVVSSITTPLDPATVVLPNSLVMGLGLIESSVFVVFLGLLQLVLIGQRSERRFRIVAETDSLTGLANRRHFLERVGPALIGDDERGALILFDIDHFKLVNDTHGHPTGDRALIAFAAILAAAAPTGGIASRVGGEEFALFLPQATIDEAAEVADRIRRMTVDLRIVATTGAVSLTVSCGVAGIGETGPDFQSLHVAADSALYAAKSAGRNQVAVHRSPLPSAQRRPDRGGAAAVIAGR